MKTTCVQVDAAQYCQYDFFMTQKQAQWLMTGAATLDYELWAVQVPPTFRPEIPI